MIFIFQIALLKEQLAQEAKRRQQYILRSSRAGQEMKQLRQTLGDSLRHIAQDPVDSELLENEARRYFRFTTLLVVDFFFHSAVLGILLL